MRQPTGSKEFPFGIRTIKFDPDHGFFLNGKHVEIRGTCNHQDAAGVGIGDCRIRSTNGGCCS